LRKTTRANFPASMRSRSRRLPPAPPAPRHLSAGGLPAVRAAPGGGALAALRSEVRERARRPSEAVEERRTPR
jgi:hypothetical protein